ncbi:ATP-binding protein [Tumebacillus amylolyticus]|uniref:ATP-binding protein n=1 Tax=Tumebacillus amylolyticus TaxID=2801339 RepID=UPI001F3672F6|nr:ATP-binding protein [Tumebacillus amylolyticus]
MARKYKSSDIFKPGTFPEHTYIFRQALGNTSYETLLEEALETPGFLTSIVGPSKSGKSVLCDKVIGPDRIVSLSGGDLKAKEDFWVTIGKKLGLPFEMETTTTQGHEIQGSAKGGGELNFFVKKLNVDASLQMKGQKSHADREKRLTHKDLVLEEMVSRDLVLVLDDFHYIATDYQMEIAQQLKDSIRKELKAVVISLPHRSDDAIRENPDLNGRMSFINIDPWNQNDLSEIANKGFPLLGVSIPQNFAQRLAKESITSPQLMQSICLNLARVLQVDQNMSIQTVTDEHNIEDALRRTTLSMAYRDVIKALVAGPPTRGKQRKSYQLEDGSQADLYGTLFKAIAKDPPIVSLTFDEIKRRVASVLSQQEARPDRRRLSEALKHIQAIIQTSGQLYQVLEWKDQEIYILDPYFLFYLRWGAY